MNKRLLFPLLFLISGFSIFSFTSCENVIVEEDTTGKLKISLAFLADEQPLIFDTAIYTNAAGNQYLVTEVKLFISNVTIYKNGTAKVLNGWAKEHYFDTNLPSTLEWPIVDDIEAGSYDSIAFTFGFKDADNQSFMYVNSPEKDMIWPEYLGGGYHYMMLNGKWKVGNNLYGFATHLGRGQIYDANNEITGFIDNSFKLCLANSNFTITTGTTTTVNLEMMVEEWFETPYDYDHNTYGGGIMENQEAMAKIRDNGFNAFRKVN